MSRLALNTRALVLKRVSTGEADRVVTLLTEELGKVTVIAKGARNLKSSKRAVLELGNVIKCQLLTKEGSMPILTQATLISDCHQIQSSLPKIRQLWQVIEMVDALFVADQPDVGLFKLVLKARGQIVRDEATSSDVIGNLTEMVERMGYQPLAETEYKSLMEYVSALADRPLRSWEYLKV